MFLGVASHACVLLAWLLSLLVLFVFLAFSLDQFATTRALGEGLLHGFFQVSVGAHVARGDQGLGPQGAGLGGQLLEPLGAARQDDHAVVAARVLQGECMADTGGGPGDEGDGLRHGQGT